MLRCLAIDDEPLALDLLEDNISKLPYLQLVGKCGDAFEAMKLMQEVQVDLIFIDIQMPGMTGLQFIEKLVSRPMVILITAYKKFALDGYSLNVVDYLVKPVEFSRFVEACNKARELYQLKHPATAVGLTPAVQDYIFVSAEYSLIKVMFSDIQWIEGWKDYLKIYLKDSSKPLITRMTLKEMEQALPASRFLRIHKSYIVSVDNITSLKKNSVFIKEKEFPVGEAYKEVIERFTGNRL